MKHWPPPPWLGAETNPVKLFYALRRSNWKIIKCPVCGKLSIAHACINPIIHVAKDHVATYEVIVAGLTWKQAREMARGSDIFGIVTKENTPKAWKKAVRMLDDLAGVETKDNFKQK